ncbi:uncharacterized protein Z518_08345 [Rhinocladiella mackenziei CBS 650.93]|uniref:Extracellular membrane protein CFEM domain-containing protein n=1 Tax=Rhinocladiella mackenziei CBS 650.93 TaxID=1442369 RepID=A0A0D2I9A1_9EURO|nr:uncharacterized protein Z518_08345 [Rhinocladiella mackenziei CBS 650.93]KIX02404.1 hypothetical protein Z518_08345 [Rhinocladiella mackenziei CBS 650.93]
MHSTSTLYLIPLLLATLLQPILTQAQDSTQYGECVSSCLSTNPIASACDGTETGEALDQCTCASFSPSGDPLISCVQQCPEDQQLAYAESLPSLCNQVLFPNLDLGSSPDPTAVNTAAPASTGLGESSSSSATTTVNGAAATHSAAGDNGAVALGASAGGLGYLAYALGVVALW